MSIKNKTVKIVRDTNSHNMIGVSISLSDEKIRKIDNEGFFYGCQDYVWFHDCIFIDKKSKTEQKVIEWAKDKDLIKPENVHQQLIKLMEEVGELSNAILKKDNSDTIDAIGDIEVVLTILCEQLGLSKKECFKTAYNVIKNRTGETVDGTFIKDAN